MPLVSSPRDAIFRTTFHEVQPTFLEERTRGLLFPIERKIAKGTGGNQAIRRVLVSHAAEPDLEGPEVNVATFFPAE